MSRPWDLRLGRWQDVLADVEMVDAVITDPPFDSRTAEGFRGFTGEIGELNEGIPYGHIAAEDIGDLAAFWTERTRWWLVAFTSHSLLSAWEMSLGMRGWYVFAPLAWVKPDAAPRYQSDGPASAVEWIVVARRRVRLPKDRQGSRKGYYEHCNDRTRIVRGGKPVGLMRRLLRDYTLPGDLIAEPFAGGATTLLAASIEGRRSIGAECDPETYAKARKRLEAGYTPTFDFGEEAAR